MQISCKLKKYSGGERHYLLEMHSAASIFFSELRQIATWIYHKLARCVSWVTPSMLIYFYKCGRHLLYCGSQPLSLVALIW
jgi:hypothetical protein